MATLHTVRGSAAHPTVRGEVAQAGQEVRARSSIGLQGLDWRAQDRSLLEWSALDRSLPDWRALDRRALSWRVLDRSWRIWDRCCVGGLWSSRHRLRAPSAVYGG